MEPIPESVEAMAERDAVMEDDLLLERLTEVSGQVRELVPDCFGMTIAVFEDDLTLTLVATDAEMAVLDAMQYLGDGPCIEAVRGERVLELNGPELLDEGDWRIFALASAACSVASTLTMPILVDGRMAGSVNLYAASAHAFTGLHTQLAELLDAWAPGAVANADLSFSTRKRAEEAPGRMRDRARLDTATGLLAAREDLTEDEARRRMTASAARAGVSLGRIAQAVITFYSH